MGQPRPKFIGAVSVTAGAAPLMSITEARLLDRKPSPLL